VGAPTGRRASAFAPGHVTGAFAPRTEARDPRARGSVGIGLVLDLGVVAEADWAASDRPRISVTAPEFSGLSISTEVARRLLARRPGRLTVRLHHQLPVGQGFGMSAAGALATALSVGRLVGVPRRRAVEIAHLADLFGGGGLGGVAAILGGGLEARRRPGIPPFGEIVRREVSAPVLVAVVGRPIPSPNVLSDPRRLGRITAAYDRLGEIGSPPSLERFWTASERFTDLLGWAPRDVRDTVRGIRRRGGRAAQAMFGRTVFAALPPGRRRGDILRWMERHEVRAVELGVGRGGVRSRRTPVRE
jgi:pantoate kinase